MRPRSDNPINLLTYAQCRLALEGDSHAAEADALAETIKNQQRRRDDVGVQLLLPGQDIGIDVARGNDGSALSLEIMQSLHSNRDVACPAALFSSQQTAVEQLCESGTVGQRQG